MFDNFKRLLSDDTTFYGLLILLVGITSFGLGRWSLSEVVPEQQASITLSEQAVASEAYEREDVAEDGTEVSSSATSGQYVASKNSTKYHLPWCPGAKQMKEENKIWFGSKAEAEAAGYTPAGNCKGL